MSSTLTTIESPLGRVNRLRTTAPFGAPALSPAQRQQLEALLAQPPQFINHSRFHENDAEWVIFNEAPHIPTPSVDWYNAGPMAEDEKRGRPSNVVLTQPQERALFLQFNYARFRTAHLCEALPGQPDDIDSDTARGLLRWHSLAMRLRDQLVTSNLALVLAMARHARHLNLDYVDMISEGNLTLLRTIDRFDVSRGFKFSTYACQSILKALGRLARQHSRHRERCPIAYDPALAGGGPLGTGSDNRDADSAEELRRILASNRAELTETEHFVITHRFALGDAPEQTPLTLQQVGHLVGLTKERVRQVQNHALKKLRQTLESTFIDGRHTTSSPPPCACDRGLSWGTITRPERQPPGA